MGAGASTDNHAKLLEASAKVAQALHADGGAHTMTPEEITAKVVEVLRTSIEQGDASLAALTSDIEHNGVVERHPSELMEHECRKAIEEINAHRSLQFVVSVDGSEGAHMAFDVACQLRRGRDNITIYHAFDSGKKDLPRAFSSDAIRERYEIDALRVVKGGKLNFIMEDKAGKAVADMVVALLQRIKSGRGNYTPLKHVDFVFTGYAGRKGVKEDATVLGSQAAQAIHMLTTPLVIVRQPLTPTPMSPGRDAPVARHFMVAVDGSPASHAGYEVTLLLLTPLDHLTIVHVYAPGEDDAALVNNDAVLGGGALAIKDRYEHDLLLRRFSPAHARFLLVDRTQPGAAEAAAIVEHAHDHVGASAGEGGSGSGHNALRPVHEALVTTALEHEVDFLTLSPRAHVNVLASVSDKVIRHLRCNVIVCKS